MTTHPSLTLADGADDAAVRAALIEHFGESATGPGITILGITSPTMVHATIHRSGMDKPRLTACGTMSHGKPNVITQVVAVTDNNAAFAVINLLTQAGISPCRMCHRCWGRHLVPGHKECERTGHRPTTPRPTVVMKPSPQPDTPPSPEPDTRPSAEPDTTADAEPGTITLDTTDDTTLAASVAKLDSSMRHRLRRALRDTESAENDAAILATICEVLAEYAPDNPALGVVFTTMEFENGYYLTPSGDVLFADGTTDNVDFDDIEDALTEEHGCRGPSYTLTVDLRTGEMEGDDYADIHGPHGLHHHFNVAPPPTAAAS